MTIRVTLEQLREDALEYLESLSDDEWCTPTDFQRWVGLGGKWWYRAALVLERLANDGFAELKTPGSTQRRFRRRRGQA
jgi:hypothetical protein